MSAHDTPEVGSGETVGERATCGEVIAHGSHAMPCDSGCQPDWHHDSCAIYGTCRGTPASPDPAQPADAGEGLSGAGDVEALVQHIYEASDYYEEEGVEWENQYGSPKREAEAQARAVLASDWLAAREAAWAEKYAAVVGERDALQVRRTTSPCGCRHPLVAGCDHSSAEAALATALREKAEDRARVEAVIEDMERRADGTGGTHEDAVRRSVCKRYGIDLRAALAKPTTTGGDGD